VAILALQRLDELTLLALGLDKDNPKRRVYVRPSRLLPDEGILITEHADTMLAHHGISEIALEILRSSIGTAEINFLVVVEEPTEEFFKACMAFHPHLEV